MKYFIVIIFNSKSFQVFCFAKIKHAIVELQNDIEFGDKFETNGIFWEQIDEIIRTLQPLYIATKEMQNVGYGLADFYVSWLRIEKNLHRLSVEPTQLNLGLALSRELTARSGDLFNTPSMTAAIYLDPRIKFKLNHFQKECAVLYLKKLYIRMQQLKISENEPEDQHHNTLDELNEEYAATYDTEEQIDTSNLIASLTHYDSVKHVDFKCNVMEFWQKRKHEFPLIYPLAEVVHAIPAGQSYEERNFSSFSFVRNAKRSRLSAENVKNILMIRLNKELFYKYKQQQLDDILTNRRK